MSDNYNIQKDGKFKRLPYMANPNSSIIVAPDFPLVSSETMGDGRMLPIPYLSYGQDGRIGDKDHNRIFVFSIVKANEIYCYRLLNYNAGHESYCQKGGCENV